MKHSTIALIQAIFALLIILVNVSLQANALMALNASKSNVTNVHDAKNILLASIITQFIAATVLIVLAILIVMYRKELETHMDKFFYAALVTSSFIMFTGGVLSAIVATHLQCLKDDPNIKKAWNSATISATIGILATLLMLMIHSFVKGETIKKKLLGYLRDGQTIYPKKPQGEPNPFTMKAEMPFHHPAINKGQNV